LGFAYAVVAGPGTWSIQRRNGGCSAWQEVRQQYPFVGKQEDNVTQRLFLGLCLLCGLCCWAALKSFPPQRGAEPLRLRTASAQGPSSQLGETFQEEVNRLRQELATLQASLTQSHQEAQQATSAAAEVRQRLQSIEEELKQQQTAFQEAQQTRATQAEALVRLQQTLDSAHKALAVARQEGTQTQQKLSAAQQQLEQTTAKAAETQTRLQATEVALSQARRALTEAQKVHTVQGEEIGQLKQTLDKEQQALASTRQDLASVHKALEAALAEGRQAQATSQEEVARLQQTLQNEQQAHTATHQTLTAAQAALNDVRQQCQFVQQQAQGAARRHALVEAMRARLAEEMQRQMVTVSQGPDYVSLHVASDALFFRSGVVLHTEAQTFLNKLATMLQDIADPVRIEGHTDNVPIRKTNRRQWPTNWELSTARAAAVARALMRKGLAAQRVTIGGYGDSRPIAANETPIGRTHNRRLDVIVRVPAEL
jgi:flagellar motor protein MotB